MYHEKRSPFNRQVQILSYLVGGIILVLGLSMILKNYSPMGIQYSKYGDSHVGVFYGLEVIFVAIFIIVVGTLISIEE